MERVEISMIMAAYNCENYIRESVESILSQTFTDFEFILIDDGSTDGTPNILKTYKDDRLRVVRQGNMGLARSLNKGLQMAQSKYIARLDADDIALPHRLATQYAFMEGHPECVASGSSAMIIDAKGRYLHTENMPFTWREIQSILPYQSPFFHSSVIYRREPALASGGYYEKIVHHFEDIVLWNKLTRYGELRNLEEPLIKYRLVPFAITNNANRKIMNEIAKKILDDGDISDENLDVFKRLSTKQGKRSKISNYHIHIGGIYLFKVNDKRQALKNFLLSLAHSPLNHRAWFFLSLGIASCINGNIINAWKKYRHLA